MTNKFPYMGSSFEEIYKKIKFTNKLNLCRIESNVIKVLI